MVSYFVVCMILIQLINQFYRPFFEKLKESTFFFFFNKCKKKFNQKPLLHQVLQSLEFKNLKEILFLQFIILWQTNTLGFSHSCSPQGV